LARTTRSRRTASTRTRRRRAGPRLPSLGLPSISPDVGRSLVGIVLLIVGAITLIALVLPGEGALTDFWRNTISPWFGTMRWALPFLLLALGWYVEWGPGRHPGSGWGATVAGISVAYVSLLGVLDIPELANGGREKSGPGDSWIGIRSRNELPKRVLG
jgi:hypothetical protein